MDINLNLVSEENIFLKISDKNKKILEEIENKESTSEDKNEILNNIMSEEIKKDIIFLKDITNKELYSINVKKCDSNGKNNNYDYYIEIKCKDQLKEEIQSKINSCMEKEKILINKQNEFKKLANNISIDEKLLEKKLLSLIAINSDEEGYYNKIIDEIIPLILDYDNFMKETAQIEDRLIKYRDSNIISLCFKIYFKRIKNVLIYIINKNIIFLNNEKLFNMASNIYFKIIKIIINEIYDSILKKISTNEIYKKNKEEYDTKLNFYREICYLFPILKFFENKKENKIYEIEENEDLYFSENKYDKIARINSQIPKRNGLNITLEYFKEHTNMDQAYAMSLRRILLIYQKFNILYPDYKTSSFLYE